jgi:hypothetical protein
MANFENKTTPGNLDTNWTKGAYVKSLIEIEDNHPTYADIDCSKLSFAWLKLNQTCNLLK